MGYLLWRVVVRAQQWLWLYWVLINILLLYSGRAPRCGHDCCPNPWLWCAWEKTCDHLLYIYFDKSTLLMIGKNCIFVLSQLSQERLDFLCEVFYCFHAVERRKRNTHQQESTLGMLANKERCRTLAVVALAAWGLQGIPADKLWSHYHAQDLTSQIVSYLIKPYAVHGHKSAH